MEGSCGGAGAQHMSSPMQHPGSMLLVKLYLPGGNLSPVRELRNRRVRLAGQRLVLQGILITVRVPERLSKHLFSHDWDTQSTMADWG